MFFNILAVSAESEANLIRLRIETGDDPQIVADAVVKASTAKSPKLRYSAGKQSRQVRALRRYMPEALVDKILRKLNGFPA